MVMDTRNRFGWGIAMSKAKSIEIEKEAMDFKVTITYHRTWLDKLRNRSNRVDCYIGNSTVWHTYPHFYRADIFTESALCNIITKYKYEESQEFKRKLIEKNPSWGNSNER